MGIEVAYGQSSILFAATWTFLFFIILINKMFDGYLLIPYLGIILPILLPIVLTNIQFTDIDWSFIITMAISLFIIFGSIAMMSKKLRTDINEYGRNKKDTITTTFIFLAITFAFIAIYAYGIDPTTTLGSYKY